MIRGRSLLALAPDLSRTGAPRLLASLLSELVRDGAIDPERTRVVASAGGPLEAALAGTASVRVLGPGADLTRRAARRLPGSARTVGERAGVAWGILRRPGPPHGPPDIVWANGAAAVRLAAALPRPARQAPLVAHIHEMEIGLRRALAGDDPAKVLDRAAVVVAVSHAVRSHLVDDLGLPADKVIVHHGWLAEAGSRPGPPRRPPGVGPEALIVGACGAVGWRKGTDLFLELARRLPTEVGGRPVHLVWVGGPARAGDDHRFQRELELRGVADRVHLVGEVGDVAPWIAGFDLFALTSREDPFPLVVLEAGAQAVPVVGFRSGGITEAIPPDDHLACLVPLFAVDELADTIAALLAEPDARRALGGALASRVRARHRAAPAVRSLWSDVAAHLARA